MLSNELLSNVHEVKNGYSLSCEFNSSLSNKLNDVNCFMQKHELGHQDCQTIYVQLFEWLRNKKSSCQDHLLEGKRTRDEDKTWTLESLLGKTKKEKVSNTLEKMSHFLVDVFKCVSYLKTKKKIMLKGNPVKVTFNSFSLHLSLCRELRKCSCITRYKRISTKHQECR